MYRGEGGSLLILGDFLLEKVGLLFDVHRLGEPGKGIPDSGMQGVESDTFEPTISDEVDVLAEIGRVEPNGADGEAVIDELLLQRDSLLHCVDEILFEIRGPDLHVFTDEIHEEVAEHLDVIGFVTQGILEHLANAGELVLSLEAEDHSEESVELRPFHTLTENKNVPGELFLVLRIRQIDVTPELVGGACHKFILAFDRGDLFKHRFALVRVDAEAANHIKEAVSMNVFLVSMATEDKLKLGSGHEFTYDVKDVVADNAFSGGKITDPHADDPALGIAQLTSLPLFDVLLHLDIFRLPVICLHRAIKLVGPLILQWQEIEGFSLSTVDDALRRIGLLRLVLIKNKGAVSDSEFLFHESVRY